jgi:hypothetical protein
VTNSKASLKELPKTTALKLTIFTPTHVTTASHHAIIDVSVAANAQAPADTTCITLTRAIRLRHAPRRPGQRALSNQGNIAHTANWRIPLPTNDNMSPLRA